MTRDAYSPPGRATPPAGAALSLREITVLAGAAAGRTNAETGRRLNISEDTVKTHMARAFRKLGATDRAHAVAIALTRGLLPMPPGSTPRVQLLPPDASVADHIRASTHDPIRRTS